MTIGSMPALSTKAGRDKKSRARLSCPNESTSRYGYDPGIAPPPRGHSSRTGGLVELELALVADPDDDGALARVASPGERHLAGDPLEFRDPAHRGADVVPVLFQIPREPPGILNRLLDEQYGVPGERGHVVGDVAVLLLIPVDERLGRPRGAGRRVVSAEEEPVAVLAAEADRLGRAPAVAPHDRFFPPELMGLRYDQGHLVVVLGSKEHLGAGIVDLRQLGAEVGVLGGKAFIGHDGPGAMQSLPGLLEELGQALGGVARPAVQDRGPGGFVVW